MNDSIFIYQYETTHAIPSILVAPHYLKNTEQKSDTITPYYSVQPEHIFSLSNPLFAPYKTNKPIFITETDSQKVTNIQPIEHRTSLSYKNTDLIIILIFSFLIIVAWLKTSLPKYFKQFFTALFIYSESNRLFNDKNAIIEYLFTYLNIIVLISGGLLFYLLNAEYAFIENLPSIAIVGIGIGFTIFIIAFRYFTMQIVSFIFELNKFFSEYIFQSLLITKAIGITILPLLIVASFTTGKVTYIFLHTSILIILLYYIYLIIRGTKILLKNNLLFLYWILYLCSAEILPILLFYKYIEKTL